MNWTQRSPRYQRVGVGVLVAALAATGALISAPTASAATANFVVNTTSDAPDDAPDGSCATATGDCSLRAAIEEANASAAAVTIDFAIGGGGTATIQVASALPAIDSAGPGVTIDGFSQPGSSVNTSALVDNAVRRVQVSGQGLDGSDGFTLRGDGNVVRGLVVNNFNRAFLLTGSGASSNQIVGNLVGLRPNGSAISTTDDFGKHCIEIRSGAARNLIGTPATADRNVISGCADKGISLFGAFTFGNKIQNNIIGLDPSGTQRRGSFLGVDVNSNANGNVIGGTAAGERNVVSGNRYGGIEVSHETGTINNRVIGNFVGSTPDGASANPATRNGVYGIRIEGQPDCANNPCGRDIQRVSITDNVVVNSGSGGILVDKGVFDSVVARNRIGVTTTGQVVGNGSFGVLVAAGSQQITIGPDNIIAGSTTGVEVTSFSVQPQGGVESDTSGNTITRNSITASGLGIDLLPVGEINTADSSRPTVNEGVLAPVLTSTGGTVTATTCRSCIVEVFASDRAPGRAGSGVTFLVDATASAGGTAAFTAPTGGWPDVITATTTTPNGSTSEFAVNIDPSTTVVTPPPPPTPRALVPLVPARLLDTRNGAENTTIDGQFQGAGRVAAGQTTALQVAGRGGVPADARAAFLNVTAILPNANGFLTVYPCGSERPQSSNVNYFPGQVEPNAVFSEIGVGGTVCIFTLADADLIADVSGYAPKDSPLGTLVPARLLDTRNGPENTTIDGQFQGAGRVAAGQTVAVQVAGRGGVPADAAAAFLNVTAILPDANGFLTVYPCGSERPQSSNVNYFPNQVEPNAVFTQLGPDGTICIYTLADADLIADVGGYAPAGTTLGTLVPARLLDTRNGPENTTIDGQFQGAGRVAADQTIELQVAGRGGVPADAESAFLNVTAILPDANGFLTVYPCGSERPQSSNVNYFPGQVEPNAVFTKLGPDGTVCIFTLADADLIADVSGYGIPVT